MMQGPHTTQEGTPFLRLVEARDNELVLPIDTDSDRRRERNHEVMKAVGIELVDVEEGDSLFQRVKLPVGWKKVVGDLTAYSHIVDSEGRKRVEIILYQAGSSEQKIFMYLCCRFGRSFDHDRFCNTNECVTHVTDGGQVIYTTEPVVADKHKGNMHMTIKEANAAASAWLNEHYPKWLEPDAYWD